MPKISQRPVAPDALVQWAQQIDPPFGIRFAWNWLWPKRTARPLQDRASAFLRLSGAAPLGFADESARRVGAAIHLARSLDARGAETRHRGRCRPAMPGSGKPRATASTTSGRGKLQPAGSVAQTDRFGAGRPGSVRLLSGPLTKLVLARRCARFRTNERSDKPLSPLIEPNKKEAKHLVNQVFMVVS